MKSRPAHPNQLELPLHREPGLWEQVDTFPERVADAMRARKKLVRRKAKQSSLLEAAELPTRD